MNNIEQFGVYRRIIQPISNIVQINRARATLGTTTIPRSGGKSTAGILHQLLKEIIAARNMNILSGESNLTILMAIRTSKYNETVETNPTFTGIIDLRKLLMKFPTDFIRDLQKTLEDYDDIVTNFCRKLLIYIIFFGSVRETSDLTSIHIRYYTTVQLFSDNTFGILIDVQESETHMMQNELRNAIDNLCASIINKFDAEKISQSDVSIGELEYKDGKETGKRIIKASPEQEQEILHIIKLALSEYSADKNLSRPLKVTIDISNINTFIRMIGELPEEYSNTLTIDGKEDIILGYIIRQYAPQQDIDDVVKFLCTYTEHMTDEDLYYDYKKAIEIDSDSDYSYYLYDMEQKHVSALRFFKETLYNTFINIDSFYEQTVHCIIHQFINKTPYLKEFIEKYVTEEYITTMLQVTSANHQDNSVSFKLDWHAWSRYFSLEKSLHGGVIKAILEKGTQNTDLKEKILSIDNDTLVYIYKTLEPYAPEY